MARLAPRSVRGRLAVALWFLLLAAGVVVLATWAAGSLTARQERQSTDTRLAANLRAGSDEFDQVLEEAGARAAELADSRDVQRALDQENRAAAQRIVSREGAGEVALVGPDGAPLAGRTDWPASRSVDVVGRGETLGQVIVGVPLDEELARRLAGAAGLIDGDALAIAEGTQIVASEPPLSGTIPAESRGTVSLAGEDFRYLSAALIEDADVYLDALGSEEPITEAVSDARRRAALFSLAAVAGLALLAWGATVLLRRRAGPEPAVAEERGRRAADARDDQASGARVREAVALVGEALAATHDPEALLPVILQSAIGATGAAGARLVSDGTEIAKAGDPDSGGSPLLLRVGTDEEDSGRLLLYPPRDGSFDDEARELAHWLAAQASIALENERLHRAVKRQAITDELTQLANRRSFAQTLGLEVRRAERFGDPLTLVLADLDDFKSINDSYGHQMGDVVLKAFADVLRANVRDFDVPARYGGEEFAILLPETELAGGEQLARRLRAALSSVRVPGIEGDRAPVTASFGVASFPRARNAEELLAAADRALYQAKREGKNRVARD
jgi:diguanylate cyclase (GGDEF)-like protein